MNRRQSSAIASLTMALALLSLGVGLGWAATPMPNPGGTPDYFYTPNWANSPPLRKFVDTLPGLTSAGANNLGQYIPVAIPDTATYPGADYYEIELGKYTEKMHSDLPPTTLQGYRQTNTADATVNKFHYLGPLIIATKDRPVRIKFKNALTPNSNLFVPVDTTVMGSGPYQIDYDPVTKAPMAPITGTFAQDRATLHLHGGRTPWISDGTPHQWITPAGETTSYPKGVSVAYVPDMWFDASGNTVPGCAGQTTCATPGATNDPGPGAQTFYWTNQQSSRLMFYHDHSWGITRLNVYIGEAAGYMITDQTEQDLLSAGLIPANQIPLVIQDKTFVDENTIGATDPTWNWGSQPGMAVNGDLWWPHVYVPAQNPYNPDMSGVNAMGRWHYGPWFWPPTPLCGSTPKAVKPLCIENGPIDNPLWDPACDPAVSAFCQPPQIPGTPNPSWGAEAFLDTPMINGTVFPKVTVEPKAYRFRILNAAHDRFLNLQFYEADASQTNAACPTCATNTEVKMVAAAPRPDCGASLSTDCTCTAGASPAGCFPATWPTDGREGGVPDAAAAGPEWIQIGTEGGFLPQPVVLPNQPVTWNMDPTMFNVGNVNGGTLILGTAERADVIVDFSQYAGKTLILYNDAPTAFPALDPHYDYYTGNPDRTDIGGSPSTPVGVGPNVRTIMQIQVAASPVAAPFDLAGLQAAFTSTPGQPGVFEKGQEPIIVGQTAYNSAYANTTNGAVFPATWPNWGQSRISDTALSFQQPDGTLLSNFPMHPKAIHDEMGAVFDDYGRMSAKLGLEVAGANATNATFVLQNYVDPSTEIVENGKVQIWKITHNGVDTHPIHFHLFDVQLLNRVGWDGFIRTPDANELGWKDTIRIAPLEDTIVALRSVVPTVPFRLPDSIRPLDPSQPLGSTMGFSQTDPLTGNPPASPQQNELYNFGWEYVWHCHILSHEENDMMRSIVAVAIQKPSGLVAGPGTPTGIQLTWTDDSNNETGFTAQRATDAAFTQNLVTFADQPPSTPNTAFGGTLNLTDAAATTGSQYFYRVQAFNNYGSLTKPDPTKDIASAWSDTLVVSSGKAMGLSPAALAFGSQMVGAPSTPQVMTVTNTGNADITITGITIAGTAAAQFSQTNTCPVGPLTPTATCTVTVTYLPTATGAASASLTVNETDPGVSLSLTMSGTGTQSVASVQPTIRAFGNQVVNTPSVAQLVTVRNTGAAPLTVGAISLAGTNPTLFAQTNTCTAPLAQAASCSINVTFTPTALGAQSAVLNVAGASVSLTGAGIDGPETAVSPATLSFGNQVMTTTSAAQTVTLSNPGNLPLTINSISLAGANPTRFAQTTTCGATLAAGANCTVNVTFAPTVAAAQSALLNVSVAAPATPRSIALSGTGILGPIATVSPTTVPFANKAINVTSTAQAVTVTNTGSASMTINGISLSGADAALFAQTNTCGATLAAGANCTVSVTVTPTVVGTPLSASLDVNVAAPAISQSVSLSGTGAAALPVAAVSPATLTFAAQLVNTTSAVQTVTVSNTGNAPMTISGFSLSGADAAQFGQTTTCGPTLAAGANCTASVTFTPTVANTPLSASLDVGVAAPATSQSVSLSGTGIAPVAAVSPATLPFVDQLVNTTSAAQTLTVSNTGTAPMTINSIGLAGLNAAHFAQTNTCGATLAANATCTVSVTFTPTVANTALSALLNVAVAAPATSQSVGLSGTGTLPITSLSTATLSFGSQLINTISTPPQTVTVSNTGTGPLTINSINLAGTDPSQFIRTSTCGATLAAGANCTVNVRFAPTVAGTLAATLDVSIAAPGISLSASLSGTGTAPLTTVSPAALSFGNQEINMTGTAQTVTVSNTGTAPLAINNITLAGSNPSHFAQTNTCDAKTLAVGTNCTVSVTFSPTGAPGVGTQNASLVVNVATPAVNASVSLSGTGTSGAPIAAVSTATLPFANQVVNITSTPQTVTVSNTGNGPLTINGISLTGADAAQFAQTNTCGTTLAVGANCTVNVTITPTVVGTPLSAALDVSVAAPATSQSVSLSGTGAATLPVASVSPATLPFAAQLINTTSALQTVTLSNTGNASMTINAIGLTGADAAQFAQTNTCGATLAAGANCTVSVSVTPIVAGILSASLDISVAAPATSPSIPLSNTGVAPVAAVSPAILPFGNQLLNTASAAQTVNVSNTGTAAMTINSIGLAGLNPTHFAQTSTCGATLAAGTNCTVSVTFTPTVADTPLGALLNVDVAAPATSQSIDLSGTGTLPVTALSVATLPFGDQVINTISAPPQTVTVSNTGSGPLTINSISLAGTDPGQFMRASTCGATLAAGANCTVNVRFAPTLAGAWAATLDVSVAAPGTSQSVTLSGTGIAPLTTVSPAALAFGDQMVNTTGTALTVNVSNTGTAPMTINSISLSGANPTQFAQTNTCGATLAAGANCTVSVTFKPTGAGGVGLQGASLAVNVATPAANELVSLSGTGISAPIAAVSPATLPFGNQVINTASAAQTVTVSNTGTQPLTINGISLTGADAALFAQTNDCTATLAAGANCTVNLTYTPTVAGVQGATLNVDVAAPATPQSVALSGTGTAAAPPPPPPPPPPPASAPPPAPAAKPVAAASPSTLSFGDQGVNTTSPAQTVTVSNTGTGMLTFTSIGLSITNLSQFTPSTTCGATLAAGANCTVSVTFNPTSMGPQSALLNVEVATPALSQSISLSGTGTTPPPAVSPETLPFGYQLINASSAAQTVTVSNPGNAPLTISSISLGGANLNQFAQTNTCGTTLAAGANCTVSLTFKPTVVGGTQSALLNVNVVAPAENKTVALSGTGTSIKILGAAASVTYDAVNDRVHLPTIETANGIFSADLVIVQSQPTLRFRVENLQVSLIAGPTTAAYEEGSTNLLIPDILVGTQRYMVTLKLVPNLPDIQFELIDVR